MTNKLYAEWHKLEFRPPKGFETTEGNLEGLAQYLGYSYSDFEDRSIRTSNQYKSVKTYRRLIDFEFINSKRGKALNRVEIHGEAFAALQLDTGAILTALECEGFTITEAHSRILLPPAFVKWDTIARHFRDDAFTAKCKIVSELKDPSNGYAKTWQAGKRPSSRSAHVQGKRLTFYEAWKIHPELPEGTTTMELQLFGDTAHKFVYANATRAVDLTLKTVGVIRGYFEFKTLDGDSNKSRRLAPDYWQKIVSNIPAIHLPCLDRAAPKLEGKIKKLKEVLFGRQQTLGTDTFIKAIADFAESQGFAAMLAQHLGYA